MVAIDEWDGDEYWCNKIIYAWRLNRKTEKIEIIPVDGIKTRHDDNGD